MKVSRCCGPGHLFVIGNPDSKRILEFSRAAQRHSRVRLRLWSWAEVLCDEVDWEELAQPGPVWLRLESPGKDWEVEKALLKLGAEDSPHAAWESWSPAEVEAMPDLPGRIVAQYQWWRGWRAALARVVERVASVAPEVKFSSLPADVVTFFDKQVCQVRLEEKGVVCPKATGILAGGYAEMREEMAMRKWSRLFLKTCHGSSASGIVALECSPRHGIQAFTTAELVGSASGVHLFNSRKVRRWTDPQEIARLCDEVCRHRAYAQQWFPKAGWDGRRLDFRVVVIGGRARHVVPRLSHSPMTNLQLGGSRGEVSALRGHMGEGSWQELLETAERAAAAFPETLHVSLDIAASSGFRRYAVLEANAFGDFLPGVLWEGRETYAWELEEMFGGG